MKRALAAVVCLFAARTGAAQPCAPRAELGGDSAAIERVANELRRLGVTVSDAGAKPEPGCSIVRAEVQLENNGGIAVAVRGASRGSEGRVVSDAALAAAWIDSWTRDDDIALWGEPPRVATLPTQEPAPAAEAPPGEPSRWDRFAIALDYERAWTDDDATSNGLAVAGCVRVGAFCVGGRARYAWEPDRLYKSTALSRHDLSLSATASYPVAIGTMSVAPEVGLGIGRMTTARVEGDCKMVMPPMNCDPMDPNCQPQPAMCDPTDPGGTMQPKIVVGDNFNTSTFSARFSLALRIAVPLFQSVWLDGIAGWTLAPFGHTSDFKPTDPMLADLAALPGEPSSGYVLGVGLRVGGK